jgi:antitoxin YefM
MVAISASEARKTLFPLIQQVNADHVPVEIVSKHGNAVLVSKEDWDSMEETAYLLRSPANAARLAEALEQARRGEAVERPLDRQ